MRAHQASRTAIKISRVLFYVARDDRRAPLLPPGAAEATEALLRATGLLKDWHLKAYDGTRSRSMFDWIERTLAPGQSTHLALRKRLLDDETRSAIGSGATQVLIVGAGFDTLGLRLARDFPDVRFVEVDHPATQSLKRHALDQLDAPSNLVLHPADLAEVSLPETLDELRWDRDAKSMVVAEGVLMYLEDQEVADFLRGVATVVPPGSRLAGTYVVPDEQGRLPSGRLGGRLGSLGRPSVALLGDGLRWAVPIEELARRLTDSGFAPRLEPGRVDLHLRYLVPTGLDDLPLASVVRIFVAERD